MTTKTREHTAPLTYLDTVGFASTSGRGFQLPSDFVIGPNERVYVVSRGEANQSGSVRVGVANLKHEWFGEFGRGGTKAGEFFWPTALAFDQAGRLFLADEFTQRISIFDNDGNFLEKWGEQGSGDGQFNGPSGLAFDSDGNLFLSDQINHRVQKFTPDGTFLDKWGEFGSGPGQFNLPWKLSVGPDGTVLVADWRNDRIQRFSPEGEFLAAYGASGTHEGELSHPADVVQDREGFIYVADWGNQRVQVFDPEGRFVQKLRGQATLSPWSIEYMEANADELEARKSFEPCVNVDVDDPHEISARVEPYFWDPVAVEIDAGGRLYVLETCRHRFQVYERRSA